MRQSMAQRVPGRGVPSSRLCDARGRARYASGSGAGMRTAVGRSGTANQLRTEARGSSGTCQHRCSSGSGCTRSSGTTHTCYCMIGMIPCRWRRGWYRDINPKLEATIGWARSSYTVATRESGAHLSGRENEPRHEHTPCVHTWHDRLCALYSSGKFLSPWYACSPAAGSATSCVESKGWRDHPSYAHAHLQPRGRVRRLPAAVV